MRVLHVAAEVFPWVKTGGLADVAAALPEAQCALGLDARLLVPGYPALLEALGGGRGVKRLPLGPAFGAAGIELIAVPPGRGRALPLYVLDAPWFFDRPGNPYLREDGTEWPDNPRRFALLSWVAAQLAAGGLDRHWVPDVLHAHDWHAGLACAYLATQPAARTRSLFTVHNLAFQGACELSVLPELGLPAWMGTMAGFEFHGELRFLKAGLVFADRITTVSPTYAREILTPAFGHQMDGVLGSRRERLHGILNGIDTRVWDPATDPQIAQTYTAKRLEGKAACKAALQQSMGLGVEPRALVVGVVSRLTAQKGIDLLLSALDGFDARAAGVPLQVVVLGTGEAWLEGWLRERCRAEPPGPAGVWLQMAFHRGYDEALAHRIIAGADVLAVPSRFEPCGLTQLYALRYGTLPLVHRVGGLADTVVNADAAAVGAGRATGFVFDRPEAPLLAQALTRACQLFTQAPAWRQLMGCAMAQDFSWETPARAYEALYRGD